MQSYNLLEQEIEKLFKINNSANVLYWDFCLNSPSLSKSLKEGEINNLKNFAHQILTSAKITELIKLAETETDQLNDWQKANLRLIKKRQLLACCVEDSLQAAHNANTIECELAWQKYKQNDDYPSLKPYFKKVVDSTREIGKAKSDYLQVTPYEALLDHYDPGRNLLKLKELYSLIKVQLPALIKSLIERQKYILITDISPDCLTEAQEQRLVKKLADLLGFNFSFGRIDFANMNFCGGAPGDVRLMIKRGKNFLETIMRALHEIGHGLYEQRLPQIFKNQPVGKALGMGVHESQSLILENQIGRSREFAGLLAKIIRDEFKLTGKEYGEGNLYSYLNQINLKHIRLEADELTYLLHIILRSEIEEELINGNLDFIDLPEVWNQKTKFYFGEEVESKTFGFMQDVHWFKGYFGYFPTYFLGSLLASIFFQQVNKEYKNLRQDIERGDFIELNSWLNLNVRGLGSLTDTETLLKNATGQELSSSSFFEYINNKYLY
jgi:carboxypeptidase Taq